MLLTLGKLSNKILGTTMAFIEFSRNQDLAKKVNKMVALAPVATVNNIVGAFKYFAKAKTPLKVRENCFISIKKSFNFDWLVSG